jgi:hypothetical protein
VQELEAKLKSTGAGGRKAGDDLSRSFSNAASEVASVVGGFLTLQGGVDAVSRSIATYVKNMEEAAEAGDKFVKQARGFAFEAGAGSRGQIMQFMNIAALHGVEDRGAAIELADTIGDMMAGDKAGTRREFAEMLKLTGAGVDIADLKDIAVSGLARGVDPGLLGREMTETAARTGLSPGALPKFMRSIELFDSLEEGMATTAIMLQRVGERATRGGMQSIVESMGEGAPKDFKKFLTTLGVGADATQAQKMDALVAAGVTSVAGLQGAGLTEISKAQPLSIALERRADILRMAGELPGAATEENLAARIARAEAENPELALARQNATLRATQANAQAFGQLAVEGMLEERQRLTQGAAFRGAGVEQFGPFDISDERGRATLFTRAMSAVAGEPAAVTHQRSLIEGILERANRLFSNLEAATQSLEKSSRTMKGGPALSPATADE